MIYTVTLNPAKDLTLTVGEIQFDEVLRAESTRIDWGGKGFNVSRALNKLEIDSVAMGFVGGTSGQQIAYGLANLGIPTDFVTVKAETRTNVVIIESGNRRHIKVNEPGPQITQDEADELIEKIRRKATPGDHWVFSGSLPPGISGDYYAQLIEIVQSKGARAYLDSNGKSLQAGLEARPYLVKPNLQEAQEITGILVTTPETLIQCADKLIRMGATWAAISLGADGLLLASAEQKIRIPARAIEIGNAVGAGDALLAGILAGITQNLSMEIAGRWGVATGSAAAMTDGVNFGSRTDIEAMVAKLEANTC